MYYVYNIKCRDGYYVGCTSDLRNRMWRHSNGEVAATKARLPIELLFYVALKDKHKAYRFEKYLKFGSGRAFINHHLA